MSALSWASTCTVTSLAISLSQASDDCLIIQTAPAVRQARKHMMAMTRVSERPVTDPGGTTGAADFHLAAHFGIARRGIHLPRHSPRFGP